MSNISTPSLTRSINFLLYSNVLVSFAAGALTAGTALLYGNRFWLSAGSLVTTLTYIMYTVERYRELTVNEVDLEDERLIWLRLNAPWLAIGAAGAALVSVALLSTLPFFYLVVTAIAAASSLTYIIPFIPDQTRWLTLRVLPYTKAIIVALVWTIATGCLPLLEHDLTESKVFFMAARFLLIWLTATAFDLRDVEKDKQEGTLTLPSIKGVHSTRVAIGLATLGYLVLVTLSSPPIVATLALVLSGCVAGYFSLRAKPSSSEWYYMGLIDGSLLLQGLSLCFTQL